MEAMAEEAMKMLPPPPDHMRLHGMRWRFGAIAQPRDLVLHDGIMWWCRYHRPVTCLREPPAEPSVWEPFDGSKWRESRAPLVRMKHVRDKRAILAAAGEAPAEHLSPDELLILVMLAETCPGKRYRCSVFAAQKWSVDGTGPRRSKVAAIRAFGGLLARGFAALVVGFQGEPNLEITDAGLAEHRRIKRAARIPESEVPD